MSIIDKDAFRNQYNSELTLFANRDEDEEKFFLIMNSVFPPESSKFISERFDLKGSTVGR